MTYLEEYDILRRTWHLVQEVLHVLEHRRAAHGVVARLLVGRGRQDVGAVEGVEEGPPAGVGRIQDEPALAGVILGLGLLLIP